eukprot:PITA_02808
MDVKTTFLNGVIEEEVYIEQPEGFETHEKKSHVCRLMKALDGLKQGPRAWLEVWQQKGEIFLGQGRYATEILKRFRMEDCRPMATPVITNWKKIDASEDKDVDPTLYRSKDIRLSAFTDANWAGSLVDRKSTSGYCFNIGSGRTSWCSRKQKSVALSSAEAESMAAKTTSCEAIWLRKLLVNLFRRKMEANRIMCDNQSCIKLSKNPVFHD